MTTILEDLEEIARLAREMQAVESAECRLCKPDGPCWWHRSYAPRIEPEECRHDPA